ncbi:MAG: extracellular solute-binding protein [Pseudomonadales bacterium]|nr:extracellular solute-binding protein [Pseudomonadales bacterium]
MKKTLLATGLLAVSVMATSAASAAEALHIYNWSDYIAEDTIAEFEKASGITVTYDVYDSNEVLEAKMLAGRSGYDLIFPTARPFADRGIRAGLYQPVDKAALTNYGNLDSNINKSLADIDPGNEFLVPYMWGTTGIAYNVEKVKEVLGADASLDSWSLIFDPETVKKLQRCGVALMDDPTEVFVAARAYKGQATDDFSKKAMEEAAATVAAVRPYIRYFHSSQTINDLANGDICVAHGYSGDMLQASNRASEADNGVTVQYVVPQEGAVVWTDVMAIPADAPNAAAANRFINYILQPEVIAPVTNYVAYANANAAATPLVDEAVRSNPGVYPAAATMEKLLVLKTPSDKETRTMNRLWTRAKTGN